MVGFRLARDLGEVVIAERILPGEAEITGNVHLKVLLSNGAVCAAQPGGMIVPRIAGRRVGCVREASHPTRTRKGTEVVIEGMVLLDAEYDIFHRVMWLHIHLSR